MAFLYLAVAALTPYLIGCLIFKDSLPNAYFCLTPFYWKVVSLIGGSKTAMIPAFALYLFLPLAAGFALMKMALTKKYPYLFLKNKISGKSSKQNKKLKAKEKLSLLFKKKVILKYFIASVLWIIIFSLVSLCFYKPKRTKFFLADYHYSNKNWSKVIEVARDFQDSNYYITHFAIHAFCRVGKLTTEMFSIPQHPHSIFLTAPEQLDSHWSKIDIYIDLGFLNMAEHEIVESIEAFGSRPVLLKRLITINLAKKNYQTATAYLKQLANTMFESKWALDYLKRMESDPDLENDSRIQYLRSVMMEKNYGYVTFEFGDVLLDLLERNPKNRIAFEYLMAWHLICGNLEQVVANFNLLDNFNYKSIPEYYQQAYLLYTSATGKKIPLKGWEIDGGVLKRYNEIVENFNLMRTGNQAAYNILSTKYNHSYLVYYFSLASITGK